MMDDVAENVIGKHFTCCWWLWCERFLQQCQWGRWWWGLGGQLVQTADSCQGWSAPKCAAPAVWAARAAEQQSSQENLNLYVFDISFHQNFFLPHDLCSIELSYFFGVPMVLKSTKVWGLKQQSSWSRFEFGILNPRLSPLMCTCPTVRWPRWDSVQLARYLEKQYRPNKFSHNTFRQLQYFMLHKLDFAS